jgi:hypothetical protein
MKNGTFVETHAHAGLSEQFSNIFAAIANAVTRLAKRAGSAVEEPRKLRCIIEYVVLDPTTKTYTKIAFLDFAPFGQRILDDTEAKLETLRANPDYFATGTIPNDQLRCSKNAKRQGGISIPFTCNIFNTNGGEIEHVYDSGFLRIAVDGFEEEAVNLIVAMHIANIFCEELALHFPNESLVFDKNVLDATETGRVARLFIG